MELPDRKKAARLLVELLTAYRAGQIDLAIGAFEDMGLEKDIMPVMLGVATSWLVGAFDLVAQAKGISSDAYFEQLAARIVQSGE